MSLCRCCGAEEDVHPAGMVDSDGVHYSHLCGDCRRMIGRDNAEHGEHPDAAKARALREVLGGGELADAVGFYMADELGLDREDVP